MGTAPRMLLVPLLALLPLSLVASPVVHTPYGAVEGFHYALPDGKEANIFLGIPYAQPPVGELRFEKPKRADKWSTVLEAKKFGAPCFQHSSAKILTGEGEFSEDCLTMNIIAPSEKSANPSGYPVMVFIHGGGFEFGSSSFYPYENITENFIPEGIVFVTFNYRLSAFGFLSTGDAVVPGNLGYWDMTLALQFIRDSIANFGGNPESVTISGESAGASSVSALTISPHSNTLFHKAIAFSGSQYSSYANSTGAIDSSRRLATALGCEASQGSDRMVACLKQKSAEEIRDAIAQLDFSNDEFNFLLFAPLIDGDFLPYETDKLLKEAPKIPMITGVNNNEGGFFSLYNIPVLFKTDIPSVRHELQRLKKYHQMVMREQTVRYEQLKKTSDKEKADLTRLYAETRAKSDKLESNIQSFHLQTQSEKNELKAVIKKLISDKNLMRECNDKQQCLLAKTKMSGQKQIERFQTDLEELKALNKKLDESGEVLKAENQNLRNQLKLMKSKRMQQQKIMETWL